MIDVISLARDLISFNNVNPPGNESAIAEFVGKLLSEHGFNVNYQIFDENRLQLIADRGLSEVNPPLVLSGHFDTVPTGEKEWTVDPFSGKIIGNKIYGRGSSDMKGGIAAMICAAIGSFDMGQPVGGVRLIFTASEEPGCIGAKNLVDKGYDLGRASAIIIGEPTSNIPAIGHKGALYLKVLASGKTAHSSMPHLGENAIYKAATAILKAKDFRFETEKDPLLGYPSINVGKMNGGQNINSVPDYAEFTIDIRSTSKTDHIKTLKKISEELGEDIKLEVLIDMTPVFTREDNLFVQLVYEICGIEKGSEGFPVSLPYLTDGSLLQKAYGGIPTIILGPGEPEMAHKTDEFCYISKLEESYRIYSELLLKWRK